MAKTVTTRLEDKYVRRIDALAAQIGVDRSALLRSFLLRALRENTIEDALKAYKDGRITLWQAAERCNMSLWEIIQEIKHRHIYSSYDMKELEKDLAALNG